MNFKVFICIFILIICQLNSSEFNIQSDKFKFKKSAFKNCNTSYSVDGGVLYCTEHFHGTDPSKNVGQIANFATMETYRVDSDVPFVDMDILDQVESLFSRNTQETSNAVVNEDINIRFDKDDSYIYITLLEIASDFDNSLGIIKYSFESDKIIGSEGSKSINDVYFNPGQLVFPSLKCTSAGDTVKVGPFMKNEVIAFYLISNSMGLNKTYRSWITKESISLAVPDTNEYGGSNQDIRFSYLAYFDTKILKIENVGGTGRSAFFAISLEDANFGINGEFLDSLSGLNVINDTYINYNCNNYALITADACNKYFSIPDAWKWSKHNSVTSKDLVMSATSWHAAYPDYCFVFDEFVSETQEYIGIKNDGTECRASVRRNSGYYANQCNNVIMVLESVANTCRFENMFCSSEIVGIFSDPGEHPVFSPSSISIYPLYNTEYFKKYFIQLKKLDRSEIDIEVLFVLDVGYYRSVYESAFKIIWNTIDAFSKYNFNSSRFRYVSSGVNGWNNGTDFVSGSDFLIDEVNENDFYSVGREVDVLEHALNATKSTKWGRNTFKLVLIMTNSPVSQQQASDYELARSLAGTSASIVISSAKRDPNAGLFCSRISRSCTHKYRTNSTAYWLDLWDNIDLIDENLLESVLNGYDIESPMENILLIPSEFIHPSKSLRYYHIRYLLNAINDVEAPIIVPGWGTISIEIRKHLAPYFREKNMVVDRNNNVNRSYSVNWDLNHPDRKLVELILKKSPDYGNIYLDQNGTQEILIGQRFPNKAYYIPKLYYPQYNITTVDKIIASADDGCYTVDNGILNIEIRFLLEEIVINDIEINVKMRSDFDSVEPLRFDTVFVDRNNLTLYVSIIEFPSLGRMYSGDNLIDPLNFEELADNFLFRFVPGNDYHEEVTEILGFRIFNDKIESFGIIRINIERVNFAPEISIANNIVSTSSPWEFFTLVVSDFNYDEEISLILDYSPGKDIFRIYERNIDTSNPDADAKIIRREVFLNTGDLISTSLQGLDEGYVDIEWHNIPLMIDGSLKSEYSAVFKAIDSSGYTSNITVEFRGINNYIPVALGPTVYTEVEHGGLKNITIFGYDYANLYEEITFVIDEVPHSGWLYLDDTLIYEGIEIDVVSDTTFELNHRDVMKFKLDVTYQSQDLAMMDSFSFHVRTISDSRPVIVPIKINPIREDIISEDIELIINEGEKMSFSFVTKNSLLKSLRLHLFDIGGNELMMNRSFGTHIPIVFLENNHLMTDYISPSMEFEFNYLSKDAYYSRDSQNIPNIEIPFARYTFFIENMFERSPNYTLTVYVKHINHNPVASEKSYSVNLGDQLKINFLDKVRDIDLIDKDLRYMIIDIEGNCTKLLLNSKELSASDLPIEGPLEDGILFMENVSVTKFDQETDFSPIIRILYVGIDPNGAQSEPAYINIAVQGDGNSPVTSLKPLFVLPDTTVRIDLLDPESLIPRYLFEEFVAIINTIPKNYRLYTKEDLSQNVSISTKINSREPIFFRADSSMKGRTIEISYAIYNAHNDRHTDNLLKIKVIGKFIPPILDISLPLMLNNSGNSFEYVNEISNGDIKFDLVAFDNNEEPANLRLEIVCGDMHGDYWEIKDLEGRRIENYGRLILRPYNIEQRTCNNYTSYITGKSKSVGCSARFGFYINVRKRASFVKFEMRSFSRYAKSLPKNVYIYTVSLNQRPSIKMPTTIYFDRPGHVHLSKDEAITISDDCKLDVEMEIVLMADPGSGNFIIHRGLKCEVTSGTFVTCTGRLDTINSWLKNLMFNSLNNITSLRFTVSDSGCGRGLSKPYITYGQTYLIRLDRKLPGDVLYSNSPAFYYTISASVGGLALVVVLLYLYKRKSRDSGDLIFDGTESVIPASDNLSSANS